MQTDKQSMRTLSSQERGKKGGSRQVGGRAGGGTEEGEGKGRQIKTAQIG